MSVIDRPVTPTPEDLAIAPPLPATIGHKYLALELRFLIDGNLHRVKTHLTPDEDIALSVNHTLDLLGLPENLRPPVLLCYPPTWTTNTKFPLWTSATALAAVAGIAEGTQKGAEFSEQLVEHRGNLRRDWAGTLVDFLHPATRSPDGVEFEFAAAALAMSERTGWKITRDELLDHAERLGWIRRHWNHLRGFTPTTAGIAVDAVIHRFKTIHTKDGRQTVEYCLLTGAGYEQMLEHVTTTAASRAA